MMRRKLIFGLIFSVVLSVSAIAGSALAYTSPGKPSGFVNDFAGILSPDQRAVLNLRLSEYSRPAGVQIAVVTVSSLGGDTIENYAVNLFKDWGIGQKINNNGVLILVAPADHKARIEVGYGLEPTITDAAASIIVNKIMIPAFREADYNAGIVAAVDRITGLIDADPETERFIQQESAQAKSPGSFLNVIDPFYLVFIMFVVVINLATVMASSKSWWLGGVIGLVFGFIFLGLMGAGVCAVIGLVIDFILSRYGSNWFKGPRGPRGPMFWGGGGFGGRGGGGFGGFGGGGSGGGGASGGW